MISFYYALTHTIARRRFYSSFGVAFVYIFSILHLSLAHSISRFVHTKLSVRRGVLLLLSAAGLYVLFTATIVAFSVDGWHRSRTLWLLIFLEDFITAHFAHAVCVLCSHFFIIDSNHFSISVQCFFVVCGFAHPVLNFFFFKSPYFCDRRSCFLW